MKKSEWKPAEGIDLEDAAIKAIFYEKNALVVAGPGAGKTELLAQKAGYLFTTAKCKAPKKILAISFKKDSADNLRKSFYHGGGYQGQDLSKNGYYVHGKYMNNEAVNEAHWHKDTLKYIRDAIETFVESLSK